MENELENDTLFLSPPFSLHNFSINKCGAIFYIELRESLY